MNTSVTEQYAKAESLGLMGAFLRDGHTVAEGIAFFNERYEEMLTTPVVGGKVVNMSGWCRRAAKDIWQERAFTPRALLARIAQTYSLEYRRRRSAQL